MISLETTAQCTDRRSVVKVGAASLAMLAGMGAVSRVSAQGTPEAMDSMVGLYGVTRSYVVKDDASVDQLNAIVEEFAAIISKTPGFVSYNVIFDEATRGYITIGVFEDQAGAEGSSAEAVDFIAEHNLGDYYVDTTPVIVQGAIAISVNA